MDPAMEFIAALLGEDESKLSEKIERKNEAIRNGARQRVFDWDHAAEMIRDGGYQNVSAGLGEDWEWTGGNILLDGEILPRKETYTYLASFWAVPEIDVGNGPEPCWRYMDETEWDAETYWPQSARDILAGKVNAKRA